MRKSTSPIATKHPVAYPSPMPGYRPSIRSLQEDFARRVARKKMLERIRARRSEPYVKPPFDMDNSEPWLEIHDSFAADWFVAVQVTKSVAKWGPQAKAS